MQIAAFTVFNAVLLGVFLYLYSKITAVPLKNGTIESWHLLRLFLDSNSLLDDTTGYTWSDWFILISEACGTIFFSGLLVSLITTGIIRIVENIEKGRIHYKLKNHIVIIGYDNIVPSIIAKIIESRDYKSTKIVLQTSTPIEEVRNTLLTKLSAKNFKRVILVHAPRQSVEELKLLYTVHAKNILIIGDRSLADHDAENMNTLRELASIHREYFKQVHKNSVTTEKKNKASAAPLIPLLMLFENEASYAALQLNDINEEWKKYFEFRPYNFYKRWANRLLTSCTYDKADRLITYPGMDRGSIKLDSNKYVHLIIIGMNRMGVALAKEAAHIIHFPNFNENTGANRTLITFIDDHADTEMYFFKGRLPGYFKIAPALYADLSASDFNCWQNLNKRPGNHFLDVQFRFIKGRIESDYVRNWLRSALKDERAVTTMAICLNNPSQSFGMAMYLPEEVYTRGRNTTWETTDESLIVNILVRQETTGTLIKSFSDAAGAESAKNKRYAHLYPFGMIDKSYSLKNHTNHLAMAFNYLYNHGPEKLNEISQTDKLEEEWISLTPSLKWSNVYLADSIDFKLRAIGLNRDKLKDTPLSEEQINALAYTEHNRWNMEKLLLGYRPLRESEKSLDSHLKKELKKYMYAHPLIKPNSELSDEDKALDKNIIKELPEILKLIDK